MKKKLLTKILFYVIPVVGILVALSTSCTSKIEHKFFYDDNVTQISDSLLIKFLKDEIAELVDSSQLGQSLRIETRISKKYTTATKKLKTLFQSDRNLLMRESIAKGNALKANLNEPNDVFQTQVMILKNATGEIIVNTGQLNRFEFKSKQMNSIYSKLYGYLGLLDKGASPLDTFRFRDPSSIGNWSSEAWDGPLYEGFGHSSSEGQPKCPYLGIKRSEWERFMCTLRIKEYDLIYFTSQNNETKPLLTTSTNDYLKTLSMIQSQNGLNEPTAISKVLCESGDCIYKRSAPNKIFSKRELNKFKLLLDLGTMKRYSTLRTRQGIIEDCHIINARFNDELTTIYSNQEYSIVFIAKINSKYKYGKYHLFIRPFWTTKYIPFILSSIGHQQKEGKYNKIAFEAEHNSSLHNSSSTISSQNPVPL